MFYYKQETNYEAPKWMEGEYKLKVHGRKITIERLSVADVDVPTKSHATCHKHDQFDIGEGAKVALDRLKDKKERATIKIGDRVEIVNGGGSYSTIKHFDNPEFAARYRYGVTPYDGSIVKVVGWLNGDESMAIVEEEISKQLGNPRFDTMHCFGGVYVIHTSNLKKV